MAEDTATTEKSEVVAHFIMILAVLIFGLNYVVGRLAVGEVPAYTLGFTRWTFAALVLLPFAWRHLKDDRERLAASWKLLVLAGFLMPFMGAGVTYVALNHTTAVNGGVIQTSMPVMIVILAWIFLRERTTTTQWLGTALAILGVLYLIARGDPQVLLNLTFNLGDAILIACNLGLAGYSIAVRRLPPGIHPLSLLICVCAVGSVIHVPFFVAEIATGQVPVPGPVAYASLAFVAIFPSVVAIMCWNTAIARLGPPRAGYYMYLTPVFAAIFGIPILGETISMFHIVGGAVIIAGVTLSSRKPKVASA
jgi:drug/metabolite transporter (DMT)-like permease